MKVVYEEFREYSYHTCKDELQAVELRLVCKNETEFRTAFQRIQDIEGVDWVGCPHEDDNEYSDIIVHIRKGSGDTIKEIKDELTFIRSQINETLGIGRRKK